MILMSLDDVRPGMLVGIGLRNREGRLVLGPGVALTPEYVGRLRQLGYSAVWIDDADTRDIPHEEMLSDQTRVATTVAIQDTFAATLHAAGGRRAVSVDEVRSTLESRRFQQSFQDGGAVERLSGQVDQVVGEVLNGAVLTGLGSLRTHSTYVFHHCLDVAATAAVIGRLLGYDRPTLKKLAVGCILHDIGTIFLDGELAERPDPLTPAEHRRVADHPVLGYLFVRDSLGLGAQAAHVAYQHHERQDGTGYPRGLKGSNRITQGSEIHMPGRIMALGEIAAIADFHDACSSERPDRPRLAPDEAWQVVRGAAGDHLNRELVELFLSVLPPYPLGTQVLVTTGRWRDHSGVVARVNQGALDRPMIRVLADAAGTRVAAVDVDLRKEDATIKGVIGSFECTRGQSAASVS